MGEKPKARGSAPPFPDNWNEATAFWVDACQLAETECWPGAVAFYRRVVRLVPDHWQWRYDLAQLLAATQRWDAALDALQPPGQDIPWEADLLASALLARAGRPTEARRRLQQAWPEGTPPTPVRQRQESSRSREDPAAEWLASALWHVGRHQDLLNLAAAVPLPDFAGHQPTLALALGWRLLLAGRAAEARSLLGPVRSYGVANAGDVPVRFAHRGLNWVAELAFRGRRTALDALPRPDHPEPVPATIVAALPPEGPIGGWAALLLLGAGRDRDRHLCADATFTLTVRAAPAWSALLRELHPDNSPARCCAARDEARALAERDPNAAARLAAEKMESIRARITAREIGRPSPDTALQWDAAMRQKLARVATLHGDAVAAELRQAYDAELHEGQPASGEAAAAATHVDLRVTLLGHRAWRLLRLPLTATLDDLHNLIQAVFRWDNDHLYAFGFGPSARRPQPLYGGPETDEPMADGTTLESLHLHTGQKFWYIFDFGDNHCFSVSVVALGAHPGARDQKPRILRVHGDPPEQYPDLEDLW